MAMELQTTITILDKERLIVSFRYHDNNEKILWYWIGTKKSLNDMELIKELEYTIQICIEKREIYKKIQRTLRV